jgi:hypothetical protein
LRVTRKFYDIENISDSDIPLAKAQRRQVRKRIYFLKPLRLSAFARDIPRFGSDVAALSPLWLILFYCCGEAGKMSDLMTTGTEPEVGINAPTSM